MSKKFNFLEDEKEQEMKQKQAGDEKPSDGAKADHADEEQDKALFAKLIKQYLGKDDADEMEVEMAKQAYQAHKEVGMEHEAAMEAAGKHLKMAAEIGKKMHQAMEGKEGEKKEAGDEEKKDDEDKKKEDESEKKEKHEDESEKSEKSEKHEDEAEKHEDEAECKEKQALPPGLKKESAVVAKLTGEIARLKETLKKYELKEYVDSKCKESKYPNSATKPFREALGTPRSKQHVDDVWSAFMTGYKAKAEEVGNDDVFFLEKQSFQRSEGKKDPFLDCLE